MEEDSEENDEEEEEYDENEEGDDEGEEENEEMTYAEKLRSKYQVKPKKKKLQKLDKSALEKLLWE